MKKLILTTVLLMSMFATSVYAQTSEKEAEGDVIINNKGIWNNWFVSAGGGVTMFAGEADRLGSLGGRLAPAIEISVGKWFTPYIGASINISGPQFKGYTYSQQGAFSTGELKGDLYSQKWNYMYLHANAMLNVTNLICGYKESRVYSFIPYAGVGWMRTPENKNDAIAVNLGIYNNFRVSPIIDLFFDFRGSIIGEDAMDSEVGGDYGCDGLHSALIGIKFRLGKQGWKKPVSQDVIDDYKSTIQYNNSEIARYQSLLSAAESNNSTLENQVAEANSRVAQSQTGVELRVPELVLTFNINSYKLSNLAKVNLEKLAEVINEVDGDHKFSIVGYADSVTGNDKINTELSQQRAKVVYNYLTQECGVEDSKLEVNSMGGVENMFYDDATLSRSVIINKVK